MNKFDLAEALIAIADSGSITKAAMKLHQTNAALSKKLSKLEDYLSAQLMRRERKGLVLTEAGQQYYHDAKKALAQFMLAEQCIIQATTQPEGELKIVSNYYYAQTVILPKLPHFLMRYPGLKVSLDIAEILPDFNAKKMDILFGVSNLGADQLVQKRVDETRYVLCASPAYLKRKGVPHSPAELLRHDFIGHGARRPNNMIILDNHERITLDPKLLVNNTELMIQSALEHLGFIWAHQNMVSHWINKKKLICLLEPHTRQRIHIYAYYEYQRYRDPKIQVFMKFFSKQPEDNFNV